MSSSSSSLEESVASASVTETRTVFIISGGKGFFPARREYSGVARIVVWFKCSVYLTLPLGNIVLIFLVLWWWEEGLVVLLVFKLALKAKGIGRVKRERFCENKEN